MKVELEKTFPMPASAELAWAFLQDIEGVAGCMPGAKITERIDPTHFRGTVAIRVGPASMAFKGDIEVRELDATQRMLHLLGKGSDTTGSSGASMDLVAHIEPTPDGMSQLVGRSEVTMSGKAAAFGGRMMGSVAEQILKQFAGNFAARVQALAAAGAAGAANAGEHVTNAAGPDASATGAAASGNSGTTTISASTSGTTANTVATGAAASGTAANAATTGAAASVTAPTTELNALTLLWAIIRDWVRGLFRRRAA